MQAFLTVLTALTARDLKPEVVLTASRERCCPLGGVAPGDNAPGLLGAATDRPTTAVPPTQRVPALPPRDHEHHAAWTSGVGAARHGRNSNSQNLHFSFLYKGAIIGLLLLLGWMIVRALRPMSGVS